MLNLFDKYTKRKGSYNMTIDDSREDVNFDSRKSLKVNTYFVILNKLDAELEKRKFLFSLNLPNLSPSELNLYANELRKMYKYDLNESYSNECQHFRNCLLSIQQLPRTVLEISMLLKEKNISDLFPYIDIVSRILLCLPASNCSAKRSFSTLKRIQNYLRSRLTKDHSNSFAILNIENEICRKIYYEDIINEFACKKFRSKHF